MRTSLTGKERSGFSFLLSGKLAAHDSPAPPMSSLSSRLSGQMVLAPLTRGGNLPFRRLCAEFGAEVTLGEMIFARQLLKGDVIERARLRRGGPRGLGPMRFWRFGTYTPPSRPRI